MDKSRYWAAIFFGVTAASVSGAIGAAFGLGPVLAAIISCAMGAGGALLAGWALGGMFRTSSDWQIAVPAAEAMEAGLGRELLGDLPLALVLLDSDSRVQLVNKSATDLFGPVAAGEPLSSMARARSLADAVSAVSAGGPPVTVEFVHMRAREQRMLLAHVRAIDAHPARDVSGIMILIEDHTRSEKVEQMRRDFIANASHELKTPLSSIAGIIETLQGPAADDPEARARFLPVMAAQAERMKRLVEDLMSLNRIEMNEHVRPNDVLEIGDVVREAVAALTPMAAGAGVAIEVRLPKTGLSVVGDRNELSQLFINLIDNAIKYGGDVGPVRIDLAAGEPGRGGMVGVSVTDLGPGIARQHIPRLTERFYRISDSRSQAKGGTGLGLSIVKHILNRHRGDLTIRSKPGEGASFIAWLPRMAETAGKP